jgi:hypothetical protein
MGTYRCALPRKRMPIIEEDIPSDKGPPPPGVIVAARRQLEDPNNEAQYGDRIPYVIARGALQERLVDRAVGPEELLDGLVPPPCLAASNLQRSPFSQRKTARRVVLHFEGFNSATGAYIQPRWR